MMESREKRFQLLKQYLVKGLFYLIPIDNLKSILQNGILPRIEVEKRNIEHRNIAHEDAIKRRKKSTVTLTNNQDVNLLGVVPLYYVSKSPMMYCRKDEGILLVLQINPEIIKDKDHDFAFCDCNATSNQRVYYNDFNLLDKINWKVISNESWGYLDTNNEWKTDDLLRKQISAEFYIFPKIEPKYIERIIFKKQDDLITQYLNATHIPTNIPIIYDSDYFW